MSRKQLAIIGITIAVAVSLLFVFSRRRPAAVNEETAADPNVVQLDPEARKNVDLGLAEVSVRPLQQVVKATGVVAPDEARVTHVFPLARGIVEKVYVQLGDKVRAGQPLIDYDNIELGQAIGEFLSQRGQLARAQAQQEVAKRILERAEALIKVEGISQQELELRRAEDDQAVAAVQSQQADLARLEEQLHRFGLTDEQIQKFNHKTHRTASHNTLRAPLNGIITSYQVSSGELIDRGKELFTIVDTSTIWVQADVYEKDIGLVRGAGTARIKIASYPDEFFVGKVAYVSDFLVPASRTAKVRCVVTNTDGRLKLEMFATVVIPSAEVRAALAVPAAALQQIDEDTVVFAQRDDNHYEKRVVRTGERTEDWVEILSGARKGEKVVTNGSVYLKSALLREQIVLEE